MNTKNFFSIAAFIMLSVSVLTSCSKNGDEDINIVNEQHQPVMKVYTLSVGAAKGGEGSTRALALDGSTVSAT